MTLLGKIVKLRSNKGEVVYTSPMGASYVLSQGERIILKSSKYQKEFNIQYTKEIKGANILKLDGIDSINDAYRLIGYSIYVEGAPDEEIADTSLDGFTVQDTEGQLWGKVNNFDDSSLNKLLEVELEGEIFYVPFTQEIVKEIDEEKGIIVIDPPEGLRELNVK